MIIKRLRVYELRFSKAGQGPVKVISDHRSSRQKGSMDLQVEISRSNHNPRPSVRCQWKSKRD